MKKRGREGLGGGGKQTEGERVREFQKREVSLKTHLLTLKQCSKAWRWDEREQGVIHEETRGEQRSRSQVHIVFLSHPFLKY